MRVCVHLLCENGNANGNVLWFVGLFLKGLFFEGGSMSDHQKASTGTVSGVLRILFAFLFSHLSVISISLSLASSFLLNEIRK